MLPEFPKFKSLELSDKADIEKITQKYPPYSDFNFFSMWSWDVRGEMLVSQLNNNLIVKFNDYITGEQFYSFLGTVDIFDVVSKLLDLSIKEGLPPLLKLLPEVSVARLDGTAFILEEDRDNFDYIYHSDKLKTYDGNKLRSKRNFFNRFRKNYTYSIMKLDPFDRHIQESITRLFGVWRANKKLDEKETLNEWQALQRIFKASYHDNLVCIGILINGEIVGFVVNELLPDGYTVIHFEKADEKYIGIYSCLMLENGKILSEIGNKFVNFEQDLGIEGLRLGKRSFQPAYFLKKYTLRAL